MRFESGFKEFVLLGLTAQIILGCACRGSCSERITENPFDIWVVFFFKECMEQ